MKPVWLVLFALLLAGCESAVVAPVRDGSKPASRRPASKPVVAKPAMPQKQSRQHVVEKGDTLFAIAFQHNLDYRDLAFWNNLISPDLIHVGQVLRLTPLDDASSRARGVETVPLRAVNLPSAKAISDVPTYSEPKAQRLPYSETNLAALLGAPPIVATAPAKIPEPVVVSGKPAPVPEVINEKSKPSVVPTAPTAALSTPSVSPSDTDVDDWRWPANGGLLGSYGGAGGKGINLAGERLSPVVATAPGKVVYAGAGLRGYGKMLIVKHADEYLSAYAHNQSLLVKEGDWVKGGQKIAEMGDTDSERVKLHFEIRQFGKPVDPMKLLPERK